MINERWSTPGGKSADGGAAAQVKAGGACFPGCGPCDRAARSSSLNRIGEWGPKPGAPASRLCEVAWSSEFHRARSRVFCAGNVTVRISSGGWIGTSGTVASEDAFPGVGERSWSWCETCLPSAIAAARVSRAPLRSAVRSAGASLPRRPCPGRSRCRDASRSSREHGTSGTRRRSSCCIHTRPPEAEANRAPELRENLGLEGRGPLPFVVQVATECVGRPIAHGGTARKKLLEFPAGAHPVGVLRGCVVVFGAARLWASRQPSMAVRQSAAPGPYPGASGPEPFRRVLSGSGTCAYPGIRSAGLEARAGLQDRCVSQDQSQHWSPDMSDVSAHGTDQADCGTEGFWLIVAPKERRWARSKREAIDPVDRV